ncbi:MAG: hypothetical protein P1U89_04045 [Verrucomicrobiales bacterium]|nr:hypothetical protein [Verrucomicrobiales bacterium]
MATASQRFRSSLPLQLAGADRVWQAARAKRFFAASIKWLILALLLLVAADLIFHLPAWARLTGAGVLLLSLLGIFGGMLWIALVSQSPIERVARLLESRAPALGSKLINMIQLQKQIEDESLPENTRSLARMAVDQADNSLTDFKLKELAKTPMEREQIMAAFLPICGVIVLSLIFFKITITEGLRFLDPFGDHPPFAFTTLAIVTPDDDSHSVVFKQNAIIEVEWSGHDPKDLFLTTWDPADKKGTTQTTPMIRKAEKTFVQQLENVTTDLVAIAHNKDKRALSSEREISVVLTPQITESKVEIALPEYTRTAPRQLPYHYKTIQALADSMLTFSITSNRPLSGGEIKVTSTEGETSVVKMSPLADAPDTVVGSIMARGSARLDFKVEDVTGIPSKALLSGGLTVTNDVSPSIRITEPYADSFIVITHELNAAIEMSDDYGISQMRLHRALNDTYSPPRTYIFEESPKSHSQTVPFHLPKLGVSPGDVISFYAEAIDNAPEPHLSRSETRHLLVISEEDYNEQMRTQTDLSMVEEKFDELLNQFDELVERQEKIEEELEKLAENDSLSEEEKQKEMDKLLAEQNELNDDIRDHADDMDNFSRDKPLYDFEKDLQERLSARAEELRQSADDNQHTGETAQGIKSPELAHEAAANQLEKMQGSREEQEESVAEPLEEMAQMHELMQDFNHFQELYQQQEKIAEQTKSYESGRQLDNADRLALQNLAAREESIREQLEELSEKLKEDAAAAEENFPKAAQSGQELAEKIDQARLPELAQNSSDSMLKGKGRESAERAERLRREMEDLMNECEACQNGGQGMGGELDQFLSFNGMTPGNTFGQMMQSRMFQQGMGNGMGMGGTGGMGMGSAGTGGRGGMTQSPNMGMLGGDGRLGNNSGGKGNSRKNGPGKPGETASADNMGKADVLPEIKPATRESKTVTPEILAEQYRGIVEEYFRALTRPKPPTDKP